MNNSAYKDFLSGCSNEINKERILNFCINELLDDNASCTFNNINKLKQLAFNIRYKFINRIDDYLITFDKNFSLNGGNIHWCIAYDDFLDKLDNLLTLNKISNVNLFSSYFSKELGIEDFIQDNNYKLSSESVDCIIFTPQFGIINTGGLLMNYNSAYDMELVMSGRLKIFVLPINNFLFKPDDVEIFLHLYSIYKDEIDYPYITSVFTPSPINKNSDIHLFLIDNGRSNVLENKEIRSALTCINCGACNKVCPIYNIIGDAPYNNVFTGPFASVVLPFMENTENYKHLCFSCTSCGNCSSVCPVKIPVSELIISNRNYLFENKLMEMKEERFVRNIHHALMSRKKMNAKKWFKNLRIKTLSDSKIFEEYKFEKSTFNQQYINNKYEK
ncbi:MAG: lactate utilization protein [Clostridia bacterium]|nr:lactate utilization protein [Clostridia bacterium]